MPRLARVFASREYFRVGATATATPSYRRPSPARHRTPGLLAPRRSRARSPSATRSTRTSRPSRLPRAYWNTQAQPGPGGVVTEGRLNLGEAARRSGLRARTRAAGLAGARRSPRRRSGHHARTRARRSGRAQRPGRSNGARNLVIHEFAHKLDMLDGIVDGTPPPPSTSRGVRSPGATVAVVSSCWQNVMSSWPSASCVRTPRAVERPSLTTPTAHRTPPSSSPSASSASSCSHGSFGGSTPTSSRSLSCVFRMNPA